MDAEQAARVLAHALPPDARKPEWRRTFSTDDRAELTRLEVSDAQADRLERILPAIAYYNAQGPSLSAARAPLSKLSAHANKAAAELRLILTDRRPARQESRGRLLQSLEMLHPERCEVDASRVTVFHPYDHREPEALRLLAALRDLEQAAQHAIARMPRAQTRRVAHAYPVELIDAALSRDGPAFTPSESAGAAFREIVAVCYEAAGVKGEPLRAIRSYLRALNASP